MRHITTKPLSAQYVFRTYFVLKFVEKKQPPTLIFKVFPDGDITPGTVVANTDTNITGVP